jgi:hypothetical protein
MVGRRRNNANSPTFGKGLEVFSTTVELTYHSTLTEDHEEPPHHPDNTIIESVIQIPGPVLSA